MSEAEAERFLWHVWYYLIDTDPSAIANQASILLVVQRTAFNDLVQREPHLGMVVMRNMALELSHRLRRTNAAAAAVKK